MKKRMIMSGILILVLSLLATTATAASEAALTQLDEVESQLDSVYAQLAPLQDQLIESHWNKVDIAGGTVLQTSPQYVVRGGAISYEALLGLGTSYYIIENPQDGKIILGLYFGHHSPTGKVPIQINGQAATATVLGPLSPDIVNLESQIADLKSQKESLSEQRVKLYADINGQFTTNLQNHQPTVSEGLLFQIGNSMMLINGECRPIEMGNIRAVPTATNGNTMVPIRALVEGLGGSVFWNQATLSTDCVLEGITVTLSVDSDTALVNGAAIKISTPVVVQNNKTMVPLRFVSEQLGAKVEWMGTDQTIHVTMLPKVASPEAQWEEFTRRRYITDPDSLALDDTPYYTQEDDPITVEYRYPSGFAVDISPEGFEATARTFEHNDVGGYYIEALGSVNVETSDAFAEKYGLVVLDQQIAAQYNIPIISEDTRTFFIDPESNGEPVIYFYNGYSAWILAPYFYENCNEAQRELIMAEFFKTVDSILVVAG